MVEDVLSKHPEIAEVELAVRSAKECSTIAAIDRKAIGEKCDDELKAIRTGDPVVEQEEDGFDVTLPLHDATRTIIGTLSLDFKGKPRPDGWTVVERAKKIVEEVETQVLSKTKLIERVD